MVRLGSSLLGLLIVLALAAPARADEVHLKTGRAIVGRVVKDTPELVRVVVEGGQIDLPRAQVARIERGPTPDEVLNDEARAVEPSDADGLERLSHRALELGLGHRAKALSEHARGVRLERRFDDARAARDAFAFVRLAEWAKQNGYGDEVRRLALDEARALDPDHPAVRRAEQELREERERVAEAARAEAREREEREKKQKALVEAQRERERQAEEHAARERADADRRDRDRDGMRSGAGGQLVVRRVIRRDGPPGGTLWMLGVDPRSLQLHVPAPSPFPRGGPGPGPGPSAPAGGPSGRR